MCGISILFQDNVYILQAQPGQRINISVADFMINTPVRGGHNHDNYEHPDGDACRVYAVVEDQPGHKRKAICAGESRYKHAYTSINNTVEIRLLPLQGGSDVVYFGLEYEGTSITITFSRH